MDTRHYPSQQFCQTLADARRAAGLSYRQLARRSGLAFAFLHKLETGDRSPSLSTAETLIKALGITGQAAETIRAAAIPGAGRDYSHR